MDFPEVAKAYEELGTAVHKECCYRDDRWSPDGKYIFIVYQKAGDTAIELYYMPLDYLQDGQPAASIELPSGFFSTPREKPQPALQPARQ